MFTRRKVLGLGMGGLASSSASMSLAGEGGQLPFYREILGQIKNLPDKRPSLTALIPDGCQKNLDPLRGLLLAEAGIKLEFKISPVDDINTQLLLSDTNSGDACDIALPATFGIPDLVRNKSIIALDSYAKRYEPAAFQQGSLYSLGDYFDDKLYGYQTDGDAYLMFFNRAFMEDEAQSKRYEDSFGKVLGIPVTWEELDQQIRFFHEPKKHRFGGAFFRAPDYLPWEWWVRFHAKGFYPLQDDLEPQIDNDAGIAALEELIAVTDYLSPASRSNGLFDNWKEYAKGCCYCNIGWGGTQKYLNSEQSNVRDKLMFSPMPGGHFGNKVVRIPYFNWGWNYTVPRTSLNPEQSYLCSLLAVSPEISTLSVRQNGYFDPFREIHYEDAEIQSMYGTDFLEAHRESMRNSIPDFYLIGQGKYVSSLKTYLNYALEKKLSPKEALQTVAKIWRGLHLRYGFIRQEEVWQRIKRRYPAHIAAVLK